MAEWCLNVFSAQEAHSRNRPRDMLMTGESDPAITVPPDARAEHDGPAALKNVEQLYRNTAPGLRRFFRNRVRDRDDADDMVQEVFVRLARDKGMLQLRNPAAWLQRVARNLVFDRARRSDVRHAAKQVPIDEAELPALAPSQMLELEAQDMLRRYEYALTTLGERSRQVFLLHRVDELSYREIAARLGISIATVEYHMMRALAHLDRALGED